MPAGSSWRGFPGYPPPNSRSRVSQKTFSDFTFLYQYLRWTFCRCFLEIYFFFYGAFSVLLVADRFSQCLHFFCLRVRVEGPSYCLVSRTARLLTGSNRLRNGPVAVSLPLFFSRSDSYSPCFASLYPPVGASRGERWPSGPLFEFCVCFLLLKSSFPPFEFGRPFSHGGVRRPPFFIELVSLCFSGLLFVGPLFFVSRDQSPAIFVPFRGL